MDIVESINRKKKLKFIDRLKAKFGVQFIVDMERLHKQKRFTLATIAVRYGVTRQRISQIHIKLFGKHLLETDRESDFSLGCSYDPRQRLALTKEGGFLHCNLLAKKMFLDRATTLGLKIKLSGAKRPDFFIETTNGMKSVIIRTCRNPKKYTNSSNIKYMRYNFHGAIEFDFIAAMHPDQKNFTIVPHKEIENKKCIYVPLDDPVGKNASTPYKKFFEAWTLLQ